MTQTELKNKIEDTREILNAAIQTKCSRGKILDISRNLDVLIEQYLVSGQTDCKTGQ